MSFQFRPAKREKVGLLIGVAGASGSGKTYSSLLLAKGMAGGKRFAVIDTEARRALHYADQFDFDHLDFAPPFSPDRYADAIGAADAAGYTVIVTDSASHEHAGDGGILDLQEAELQRMAGDDWKKREAVRMASWIRPKMSHKKFVQRLLQVRAHLILCLRAESKIEMVKGENGKMIVQPKQTLTSLDGWIPICEKSLPFELTCSFLLTPDAPGVPKPIKLQEQHRPFFPPGKPITEAAGVQLAQWASGASGGAATPKPAQPAASVNGGEHRGVCGQVLERMAGKVKVFDAQINGEIFSTTDASLAERARQFAGIPVVATFTPTAKGGRQLIAIYDAEDPHV